MSGLSGGRSTPDPGIDLKIQRPEHEALHPWHFSKRSQVAKGRRRFDERQPHRSSGAGIGIVLRTAIEASDEGKIAVIQLVEAWSQRNLHVCVPRNPTEKNLYRAELVAMLCRSPD